MAVHLDGRAPHREIAALLDEAARCKTAEKRRQLMQRVPHLARVFTSLVAEFRASVPVFERKRGIAASRMQRDAKLWKPIEEAYTDNGWFCGPGCNRYIYYDDCCLSLTLEQWIEDPVFDYDDRPSAIVSLLQHGGTNYVREMIDNGLDLRKLNHFPSRVDGGLHLVQGVGPVYIWLNQLLLCLRDDERVSAKHLDDYCSRLLRKKGNSKHLRRANAAEVLQEAFNACSTHEFHGFCKWSSLRSKLGWSKGVTRTELLALANDLFQLMYRTSHVCLYNELRHKKRSPNIEFDMEDSSTPDALMFQLEVVVTESLLLAVNTAMRSIHGVGRDNNIFVLLSDLWDSNGAVFTKRLLRWSVRLRTPLNFDVVRAVLRKNRNLREIDVEVDNSTDHAVGDECRLWKLLHDFVSCFIVCTYLTKFSLHISILPIARYDEET